MAYDKKIWLPRIPEYPGRVRLIDIGSGLYTIQRADGTPTQEGDAFSDSNMNDLEDRIEEGLGEKLDKTSVIANRSTTVTGYALDATIGKELGDNIDSFVSELTISKVTLVTGLTLVRKGDERWLEFDNASVTSSGTIATLPLTSDYPSSTKFSPSLYSNASSGFVAARNTDGAIRCLTANGAATAMTNIIAQLHWTV